MAAARRYPAADLELLLAFDYGICSRHTECMRAILRLHSGMQVFVKTLTTEGLGLCSGNLLCSALNGRVLSASLEFIISLGIGLLHAFSDGDSAVERFGTRGLAVSSYSGKVN